MPEPHGNVSSFGAILDKELAEIRKRRAIRAQEAEEVCKQRAILARELREKRKHRASRTPRLTADAGPPSETRRPEELFPSRKPLQQPSSEARVTSDAPAHAGDQATTSPPGQSGKSFTSSIGQANHENLLGLAFSGGGIRSATFNLGVLQGLAKHKLLHRFDYLSTISGGGYIGAWLAAWIYRRDMREVEARLGSERKDQPHFKDPPEIRFLREYSNYLTPRKGFLGADTWTAIAIYCRNLLLNLLVLILFISAILLAPRALTTLVQYVSRRPASGVSITCSPRPVVRALMIGARSSASTTKARRSWAFKRSRRATPIVSGHHPRATPRAPCSPLCRSPHSTMGRRSRFTTRTCSARTTRATRTVPPTAPAKPSPLADHIIRLPLLTQQPHNPSMPRRYRGLQRCRGRRACDDYSFFASLALVPARLYGPDTTAMPSR